MDGLDLLGDVDFLGDEIVADQEVICLLEAEPTESEQETSHKKCSRCLQFGHDDAMCTLAPKETGNRSVLCGQCGEVGHNKLGCPSLGKVTVKEQKMEKATKRLYTCGLCRSTGHGKAHCPSRVMDEDAAGAAKKKLKGETRAYACGLCGVIGHAKSHCPRKDELTPEDVAELQRQRKEAKKKQKLAKKQESTTKAKRFYTCGNCGFDGHRQSDCPHLFGKQIAESEVDEPDGEEVFLASLVARTQERKEDFGLQKLVVSLRKNLEPTAAFPVSFDDYFFG